MIKLFALIFLILACASFFVNGASGNVSGWGLLILANIYSLANIMGAK
tara:strand:- start:13959 stop:14102 length:144 start_codon:yes stop_codon:yes gene_type:complete